MIYITGDTHGQFGRINRFTQLANTTTDDIMIILGDAGLNYYLSDQDDTRKKEVSKIPLTFFCIHGNHEERPNLIGTYHEITWHGGIVYVEDKYPNILFAKDGEVYDFDGKSAIVIGGAYSVDKFHRLARGWNWFESEQPDEETKNKIWHKLMSLNWKIDYVLSHTCPLKYEPVEVFLPFIDQSDVDKSTEEFLNDVENALEYEKWYCGHYHTTKSIDKIRFMFEDIDVLH